MTDRAHSLTVALERDTRDDDLEHLVAAIRMMRGVADVEMNIVDAANFAYETRASSQMQNLLLSLMKAVRNGGNDEVLRVLEGVKARAVI